MSSPSTQTSASPTPGESDQTRSRPASDWCADLLRYPRQASGPRDVRGRTGTTRASEDRERPPARSLRSPVEAIPEYSRSGNERPVDPTDRQPTQQHHPHESDAPSTALFALPHRTVCNVVAATLRARPPLIPPHLSPGVLQHHVPEPSPQIQREIRSVRPSAESFLAGLRQRPRTPIGEQCANNDSRENCPLSCPFGHQ